VFADAPRMVNREAMTALRALGVDMPAAIVAGRTDFVAIGMERAYCGAPAGATPEERRATVETPADRLGALVPEEA
jgi:creatinine amidohydrolase